jgi:hypothetical protein
VVKTVMPQTAARDRNLSQLSVTGVTNSDAVAHDCASNFHALPVVGAKKRRTEQ